MSAIQLQPAHEPSARRARHGGGGKARNSGWVNDLAATMI